MATKEVALFTKISLSITPPAEFESDPYGSPEAWDSVFVGTLDDDIPFVSVMLEIGGDRNVSLVNVPAGTSDFELESYVTGAGLTISESEFGQGLAQVRASMLNEI